MYGLERKRFWLACFAAIGAAVALYFTYRRTVIMAEDAKERELASYRQRLFDPDPSARIAVAMSLSKGGREIGEGRQISFGL